MKTRIVYVKTSTERARELAVTTKIYECEDGSRHVMKYATYPEGKQHLQQIYDAYEDLNQRFADTDIMVLPCEEDGVGLRFPYIEGRTLEDHINGLLEREKYDEAKSLMAEYISKIRSVHQDKDFQITAEFEEVFGHAAFPKAYKSGTVNNIDMVLDNVVLCDEQTYLIDYEWTFPFAVPVDFLIYRIVHYFVYRNKKSADLMAHGFLSLMGVTDEERQIFEVMEEHFQQYVVGNVIPIRELYGCMGAREVQISHALERMECKVYYNHGEGFSEKDTDFFEVDEQGDFASVQINIPQDVSEVRIDPIENKFCYIQLLEIIDENGINFADKAKSNGVKIGNVWYFLDTQDPWFLIAGAESKVSLLYQMTVVEQEDMQAFSDIIQQIQKRRNNQLRKCVRTGKHIFKMGMHVLRHVTKHGFKGLGQVLREDDKPKYHQWFLEHRVTEEELMTQRKREAEFAYRPKISILVPTYKTPIPVLKEMLDSVRDQSYANWELCIADGSMGDARLEKTIAEYQKKDARIVYHKLDENKGISGNTNGALAIATGEYVGLLDHDDLMEPDALYEVVLRLQQQKYDILYTDEDKINGQGTEYMDPNFKPDFSIDLFRSHNYITHFFVVKKNIIDSVGGFRSEYDGSQDYDLMFRCIEQSKTICHIPKILYHWRMIAGSTAENPASKMYCYEAGRKAVESHLARMGIEATVEYTKMWGIYHTKYKVIGEPLVSIIIANKDLTEDLDICIRSIEGNSTYRNFEIIVVENNSTEDETFVYYERIQKEFSNVHVITWEKEFNYSAINNYGVKAAKGKYILLLNNDTEMITPTAIEEMLGICMRQDVGIVGAKLLYGDDTIQHAGVVIGFGGYAGHVFHGIGRDDNGYMVRPRMNCNYSAVTAACLMVKRCVYDEVDGLTEAFKVAGNDIDFCLKVREKGYLVVYNAFSEWYHYESKSRGYEDTPEKRARFDGEVRQFQERWGDILEKGDPYYNPNFPITLAPFTLDY